jgi:hypothetical protein
MKAAPGVLIDGFNTIALPYIKAGIVFLMGVLNGKFQGFIPRITPLGRRVE